MLGRLLEPAIAAAEHGHPVAERVARDWARQIDKLRRNGRHPRSFCRAAVRPLQGRYCASRRSRLHCARIAREGSKVFYEGWIARDMVDTLRAEGGEHTLEDFADYEAEYVDADPRKLPRLRHLGVPAQWARRCPAGDAACDSMDFDCRGGRRLDSVDYYHALVEIGRQAYADRDCFIGDPRTGDVPVAKLLSDDARDGAARSCLSTAL